MYASSYLVYPTTYGLSLSVSQVSIPSRDQFLASFWGYASVKGKFYADLQQDKASSNGN